jgi:hypothetical protein
MAQIVVAWKLVSMGYSSLLIVRFSHLILSDSCTKAAACEKVAAAA